MMYPDVYPQRHQPAPTAPAMGSGWVPAHQLRKLMLIGTILFMISIGMASVATLSAEDPDQAFKLPGPFLAVGLGLLLLTEAQAGLRNLVRTDIFMLLVLFLLTFFEFLLPLPPVTDLLALEAAQTAALAALLGFAGIVLGRHAFPPKAPLPRTLNLPPSPTLTMVLLCGCAFMGHLYMLLAVDFDIFEMIEQMQRPRFSQPWTRGRLGGLNTLLNEFGLLTYLVPPLSAAVLSQGRHYGMVSKLVALALLALVLFAGFAGGTRNIFLIHVITFAAAYSLLMRRLTLLRFTALMVPLLTISFFAIYYLPEIRTVGLENFELEEATTEQLVVDLNLVNVAFLTEVFPNYVPYLGFEIPYNAAIRPIPRALWSGKPEGLSVGIEEALGVEGMTLSATFVGELWMAGGYGAVLIAGLSFGALAARWNRRLAHSTTGMDMIIFAVGLFPAGIAMRSFLSSVPALLPIAFILTALYFFGSNKK